MSTRSVSQPFGVGLSYALNTPHMVLCFPQTRVKLATLGYMIPAILPTKMAHGVRQVHVVIVPVKPLFIGIGCTENMSYVCVHCLQILLPLIDQHVRHWLLLQVDLRQRCFFVYDSCSAAWGRDKEERKLLINRAVKFLLL